MFVFKNNTNSDVFHRDDTVYRTIWQVEHFDKMKNEVSYTKLRKIGFVVFFIKSEIGTKNINL